VFSDVDWTKAAVVNSVGHQMREYRGGRYGEIISTSIAQKVVAGEETDTMCAKFTFMEKLSVEKLKQLNIEPIPPFMHFTLRGHPTLAYRCAG